MRWGFGTSQGPFELWQQAGWKQVAEWVKADIDAGKALSKAPLPAWVFDGQRDGACTRPKARGAPKHGTYVAAQHPAGLPAPALPRERARRRRRGAADRAAPSSSRTTRCASGRSTARCVIASITAKLHLISPTVAEGLQKALELAEQSYKGLVIWSPDDVFSAGANLEALMPVFMKSGAKGIAPELKKFQDFMLRVRYAQVPVVSAVRGIALGGGCELAVYSAKRVAAMESYMGLVEVGVGLVPGAGGLTYIARRAAEMAAAGNANADILKFLTDGFTNAAMAKVGTSAIETPQARLPARGAT